jgi:hypothetical protein
MTHNLKTLLQDVVFPIDPIRLNEQIKVIEEVDPTTHHLLLNLPTGFGKTLLSILIAQKMVCAAGGGGVENYDILVLLPKKSIKVNWLVYGGKISTIQVHMLRSFYNRLQLKKTILEYDCLIIDEFHLSTAFIVERVLPKLHYKHMIALSATPPSLESLAPFVFDQIITRSGMKTIHVLPIYLPNFSPSLPNNTHNYGRLLNNTLKIVKRKICINNMLSNGINSGMIQTPVLILVKRVAMLEEMTDFLHQQQQSLLPTKEVAIVDTLHGKKIEWNPMADILIGTYQKIGVGFDARNFRSLVLMDNILDIRQAEGRIRNNFFIIFDVIDTTHPIFLDHWHERTKWYQERGASIIDGIYVPLLL